MTDYSQYYYQQAQGVYTDPLMMCVCTDPLNMGVILAGGTAPTPESFWPVKETSGTVIDDIGTLNNDATGADSTRLGLLTAPDGFPAPNFIDSGNSGGSAPDKDNYSPSFASGLTIVLKGMVKSLATQGTFVAKQVDAGFPSDDVEWRVRYSVTTGYLYVERFGASNVVARQVVSGWGIFELDTWVFMIIRIPASLTGYPDIRVNGFAIRQDQSLTGTCVGNTTGRIQIGRLSSGIQRLVGSVRDIQTIPGMISDAQAAILEAAAVAAGWYTPVTTNPGSGFGYACGGMDGSSAYVSTVDKFAFTDDSRSTLSTGLSSNREMTCGFESATFGYAAGGWTGSSVATVDKFAFSNDARTTLGTGLSVAKQECTGFNSSTYGYAAGGWTTTYASSIDKFQFSDDSRTTLATGLSRTERNAAGFQSSTHGYVAGGDDNSDNQNVDKFRFSDDARTAGVVLLSEMRYGPAGFESTKHGYAVGGFDPGMGDQTSMDIVRFSDDVRFALLTVLSSGQRYICGFKSLAAGYAAGGGTATKVATVDKIAFATNIRSTLGTGLSGTRRGAGGFSIT